MLETKVPVESQLIISNPETDEEVIEDDEDEDEESGNQPTVVLSGKITLAVLSKIYNH